MSRRFIVKKRWSIKLDNNGRKWWGQSDATTGVMPAHQDMPWRKFVVGLNCVTDWKDASTGGADTDIKHGALYLVSAAQGPVSPGVYGRIRVYFKSVMGY
jgi:hypothetical protein